MDHMGLFLKRLVCEAEAPGGCIHVVGVVEGGVWEGMENTVDWGWWRSAGGQIQRLWRRAQNMLASMSGEMV